MPAIFTHVHFGNAVVAILPPALRALKEEFPEAFYLGTQGPDLLFYHKPFKKKEKNAPRKKGWDLHAEAPETFFLNGAKLLLSDDRNRDETGFFPKTAEGAYLMGFLCHFTLDSHCHPMIDEHSVNGLSHGKIESELDKYFFKKLERAPRGYNAAKLFSKSVEAQAASAAVLGVTEKNTRVAIRTMRRINGLFSSRLGLTHGFCHAALSLAGMNKTFGEMFLHKKDDPRCQTLLSRLEERFNVAVQKASEIIPVFFERLPNRVERSSLDDNFYRYDYSGNHI